MARIPEGPRMVGSHVTAVNAEAMPRKRHRTSGFNVKEGAYRPIKRNFRSDIASINNRKGN